MVTNVSLTPEMEQFARSCVEAGRYNNISEVVRSGLRLLQDAEDQRARFQAMLMAVEAETAQHGALSLEDVLADVDALCHRL